MLGLPPDHTAIAYLFYIGYNATFQNLVLILLRLDYRYSWRFAYFISSSGLGSYLFVKVPRPGDGEGTFWT